jgi:hypothetical protein
MLNYGNATLAQVSLHRCGDRNQNEGTTFSEKPLDLNEETERTLCDFMVAPFSRLFEEFRFNSESLVKPLIEDVFAGTLDLFEASKEITDLMYEVGEHPKIGSGDVLVGFIKGLVFEESISDAICIVKIESKENFLITNFNKGDTSFKFRLGSRSSRIEKAFLVLNKEDEQGYRSYAIDSGSRGDEAYYWKDRFLGLEPKQDKHFQTKQLISVYKDFVVDEVAKNFEATKADQADLIQRSINYLKGNEKFNMEEFQNQVIVQPEVIDAFKGYVNQQAIASDYQIPEEFEISEPALKKQGKFIKSVIKLDKNFHVYVHGSRENIERGFDEATGRFYYKLFFKEEI